jgi:hypothetical protein
MEWQISLFPMWNRPPQPLTLDSLDDWVETFSKFKHYKSADEAPPDEAKNRLACWSPTIFKGKRTKATAIATCALVLDYDHDTTIAEASALWSEYYNIIYTSYNHKRDDGVKYLGEDRFRLVLPLASPVNPKEFEAFWLWALERSPTIDDKCKDVSRLYAAPAIGRYAEPESRVNHGPLLDFREVIGYVSEAPKPPKGAKPPSVDPEKRDAYVEAWREMATVRIEPLKTIPDGRHEAFRDIATLLAGYDAALGIAEELSERMTEAAEILGRSLPDTFRGISDGIANGKDRPLALSGLNAYLRQSDPEEESPDEPFVLIAPNGRGAYVREAPRKYTHVNGTAQMTAVMAALGKPITNTKGAAYGYETFCRIHEAKNVKRIHYTHDPKKVAYDPESQVLTVCATEPQFDPKEHPEVGDWLEALVNRNPKWERDLFFKWLANAYNLDWPIAALYLHGPPSCGKSMLAPALASPWGVSFVPANIAFQKFNDSLLECPIIGIEEGLSPEIETSRFKDIITLPSHTLGVKGQKDIRLISHPRLVIGANNAQAIHLDRVTSAEDLDAMEKRILYIEIKNGGQEFLKRHGNWGLTTDWVSRDDGKKPGKIAEHIAWMSATAERPSDALLLEGRKGGPLRWHLIMMVNSTATIVHAVMQAIKSKIRDCVVATEDGDVAVKVDILIREWRHVGSDTKCPGPHFISQALGAISKGPPEKGRFILDSALIRSASATTGIEVAVPSPSAVDTRRAGFPTPKPKTEPVKVDANVAV